MYIITSFLSDTYDTNIYVHDQRLHKGKVTAEQPDERKDNYMMVLIIISYSKFPQKSKDSSAISFITATVEICKPWCQKKSTLVLM